MRFLTILTLMVIILPSLFLLSVVESYLIFFLFGFQWVFGPTMTKPILKLIFCFFLYAYSMWMQLTSFALEVLIGTGVSISYVNHRGEEKLEKTKEKKIHASLNLRHLIQPPSKGKVKIIICNHHSRADWVYMQLLLSRTSLGRKFHVVLKENLKRIPFFGVGIQMHASLLLSRSWAADKIYLSHLVKSIKDLESSSVVQIYPEGTDLSKSNVEKSQEFAKKHNLPQFLHVLNPRTVGVVALKEMFGNNCVESVIDVTLGYTYGTLEERPNELNLVSENHAVKVHLLVQEYPMEGIEKKEARETECKEVRAVPKDSEAFAKWIHQQFELKEQLLSRFYHTSPVGFDEPDVKDILGESIRFQSYDSLEKIRSGKTVWKTYLEDFGVFRGAISPFFCFIFLPLGVFRCQCYLTGLSWIVMALINFIALLMLEALSRLVDLQKFFYFSSDAREEGSSTEPTTVSTSFKKKEE